MWKWLDKLGNHSSVRHLPYTLHAEGPATFRLERRLNKIDLVVSAVVSSFEIPGQAININITISDPEALRGLSALLLNAAQHLEPPYYAEEDIGPLWEGEHMDIYVDAIDTVGEEWLHAPNVHFGGKTPEEVIKSGKDYWVREILRSIKIGTFS